MKKIILAILIAFGLVACGDLDTGDSSYTSNTSDYHYTENNIDYGSGTVLQCNDANCSVMKDESGRTITNGDDEATDGDAVIGKYDPSYTQSECQAAGFFYCTISDSCTNQRVDDSSSSCSR